MNITKIWMTKKLCFTCPSFFQVHVPSQATWAHRAMPISVSVATQGVTSRGPL